MLLTVVCQLVVVAAGAAEGEGARVYAEEVLSTAISGFRFN